MSSLPDSTSRFTDRVDDYVRARPSYPPEVLQLLQRECGLNSDSLIADIGAGTGILTKLFLEHGNHVFAVEPNREMRIASEHAFAESARFTSIAGTAEATTLPDHSVDLITAAQAFHWFKPAEARAEFLRIGRPQCWTVLIWNERRATGTPFLQAYEALLVAHGTDYLRVDHRLIDLAQLESFFSPALLRFAQFENMQTLDWPKLVGRLLSSSFVPQRGTEACDNMLARLRRDFDAHQIDGAVHLQYDTKIYFGQLASSS